MIVQRVWLLRGIAITFFAVVTVCVSLVLYALLNKTNVTAGIMTLHVGLTLDSTFLANLL
jgi:hypothetical protein